MKTIALGGQNYTFRVEFFLSSLSPLLFLLCEMYGSCVPFAAAHLAANFGCL